MDVVVASAERHRNGSVLVDYPFGAQDLALDAVGKAVASTPLKQFIASAEKSRRR